VFRDKKREAKKQGVTGKRRLGNQSPFLLSMFYSFSVY
jgi:hypothetical protein